GLLEQLVAQRGDGVMYELAPVVDRADDDPVRQAGLHLHELFLDPLAARERILPAQPHLDAAYGVPPAIQVCHAAAHRPADAHLPRLRPADGRAVRRGADYDVLDVFDGLEIAESAHHVLALAQLDDHRPDVGIGVLDRLHDRGDGDAVPLELGRI